MDKGVTMKVRTLVDIDIVPAGSVLQDVKEVGPYYKGLWTSQLGSYEIKAKKEHCEIIVE